MPLETIKSNILAEAEATAKVVGKEADEEASRIREEARRRARMIIKKAEEDAGAEGMRLQSENNAGLEIETNAIIIEAKNGVIERALQRVRKGVESEIRKSHLQHLLEEGLRQFSKAIGSGRIVARTSKKSAGLVKGLGPEVETEYGDVEGVELSSEDGRMRLSINAGALVDRNLDVVRKEISRELFVYKEQKHQRRQKRRARTRKASARAPRSEGKKRGG